MLANRIPEGSLSRENHRLVIVLYLECCALRITNYPECNRVDVHGNGIASKARLSPECCCANSLIDYVGNPIEYRDDCEVSRTAQPSVAAEAHDNGALPLVDVLDRAGDERSCTRANDRNDWSRSAEEEERSGDTCAGDEPSRNRGEGIAGVVRSMSCHGDYLMRRRFCLQPHQRLRYRDLTGRSSRGLERVLRGRMIFTGARSMYGLRASPSSIGSATRTSTVRTKRPSAQTPAVTPISTGVGLYSTISPSGDGMNPGTTRPIPFSIQMPMNNAAQEIASHLRLRRIG